MCVSTPEKAFPINTDFTPPFLKLQPAHNAAGNAGRRWQRRRNSAELAGFHKIRQLITAAAASDTTKKNKKRQGKKKQLKSETASQFLMHFGKIVVNLSA